MGELPKKLVRIINEKMRILLTWAGKESSRELHTKFSTPDDPLLPFEVMLITAAIYPVQFLAEEILDDIPMERSQIEPAGVRLNNVVSEDNTALIDILFES